MKPKSKVSRAEVRAWPEKAIVSIALANTAEEDFDDDYASRIAASKWVDGVEGYFHPNQEGFGDHAIVIAKHDGIDWCEVTP